MTDKAILCFFLSLQAQKRNFNNGRVTQRLTLLLFQRLADFCYNFKDENR